MTEAKLRPVRAANLPSISLRMLPPTLDALVPALKETSCEEAETV